MAQYFTDFSEYATGLGVPTGWTQRWAAVGEWRIEDDATATGGKRLRYDSTTTEYKGLSWDAPSGDANLDTVEIYGRMMTPLTSGAQHGLLAWGAGTAASRTGIEYRFQTPYSTFSRHFLMQEVQAGAVGSSSNNTKEWNGSEWWHLLMRVDRSLGRIYLKAWKDGTAEPAAWDKEIADSTLPANGWVGIMEYASGSAQYWDMIGVGTAGDSAPRTAVAPANTAPTVTIDQGDTATLPANSTLQLTATVTDTEDDPDPTPTWASDNTAVATVDAAGLVTWVSAGTAIITATATDSGGLTGSDSITITAEAAAPDQPDAPTVTVSGVTQTTARITGSAYSHPYGDAHQASQFRVLSSTATVLWDSGTVGPLLEMIAEGLPANTAGLTAEVRYQASDGTWGAWGVSAAFTTACEVLLYTLRRRVWGAAEWEAPFISGLTTLSESIDLTAWGTGVWEIQAGAYTDARPEVQWGTAVKFSVWCETEPGIPCTLLLEVYATDGVTVEWSASNDPAHPHPYLTEPSAYGEQEVDFAEGRASIAQVNVRVVDVPQAGDQQNGWLTSRLADAGGITAIAGRRCRLRRWINNTQAWVTIADGPGDVPRMAENYAAYGWAIRDTRESERRLRAFIGGTTALVPTGVHGGFGHDAAAGTYLVNPATPAPGTYQADKPESGYLSIPSGSQPTIPRASFEAMEGEVEWGESYTVGTDTIHPYTTTFGGRLAVLWRLSGATDWERLDKTLALSKEQTESGGSIDPAQTNLANGYWADAEQTQFVVTGVYFGDSAATPNLPAHGAAIELLVVSAGLPSEQHPQHIEGLTAGALLKKLYGGEYSPRDAAGAIIPTGIRYDAVALDALNTPVRLRITEPVKNLREWAEKHLYAPLGYAPALDSDGRISPVKQDIPTDLATLDALTVITNAITNPAPAWQHGSNVINVLRFTYLRAYKDAGSKAADGLFVREITREYLSPDSVDRFGEQELEIDTHAFVAVGDADAGATGTETGHTLADARDVHLGDRRKFGTPLITVQCMRISTFDLRVGDWVRLRLSWMPDYGTQLRSLDRLAQILAVRDLNCSWREFTFEDVKAWPVQPLYLVANGADRAGFDLTGPAAMYLVPNATTGRLMLNDASTGAVVIEYDPATGRIILRNP